MNYDRTILAGHLTRDPELKTVSGGHSLCKFGIAVNSYRKEGKDDACFIDCLAWGKVGETIAEYLKRGSPIFIEGRHTFSSWDDKASGQRRNKLEVTVERFQFLGEKTDAEPAGEVAF